jgi:hypothetical protein
LEEKGINCGTLSPFTADSYQEEDERIGQYYFYKVLKVLILGGSGRLGQQ